MPPFLLSLLTSAKGLFASAFGFLAKLNPYQLACLGLGLFALVQHFEIVASHHHSRKIETQLTQCSSARHADQLAYAKAQTEAQAKNIADVAHDKAERERISNEISQSYEAQLASLRADLARRLRQQTAPGHSGGSGLPNVSPSASGPDGPSRVSIPSGLYVRGAELELQLEQLEKWINEQVKVDPNK